MRAGLVWMGWVATTVLAVAFVPSAPASHNVGTEPNDTCEEADEYGPMGTEAHWSRIYNPFDVDMYKVWVNAGDEIYVWMDPDFVPNDADNPSNFDLALRSPWCEVVARSEKPGFVAERLTYVANTTGWWYAEVYPVGIDYGGYWHWWEITPPACFCSFADPATLLVLEDVPLDLSRQWLGWERYYVEERGNPFGAPFPGTGLLFGPDDNGNGIPEPFDGEGTWIYQETNGKSGLQRGGIGFFGDYFPPGCSASGGIGTIPCMLLGEDPINDENCGFGPDNIIAGGRLLVP